MGLIQLFPILFFFFDIAAIGRTLIPRYFRSIFEGGVTDLYFHLKLAKESFHNSSVTLDCDQCTMVTHHGVKPTFTKVGPWRIDNVRVCGSRIHTSRMLMPFHWY